MLAQQWTKSLGVFAVGLLFAAPTVAQTIDADTTGEDNLADPRYYGVKFSAAGPATTFVQSISFDISADIDGFFDLDGVTNFGNAFEPVTQVSSLVGLTAADITWSFAGTQPNVITANFAPGSFGLGDSFRFGCETDMFVADPCRGGNFALGGALFSVTYEHGQTASSGFTLVNSEVSTASVTPTGCSIELALPSRVVKPGEQLRVDLSLVHNAAWTANTNFSVVVMNASGKQVLSWQGPTQVVPSGGTLATTEYFQIPANAKPGVYRLGAGIGDMDRGFALRSMEFVVEAAPVQQQLGQQASLK